jgi:hypothetical protein
MSSAGTRRIQSGRVEVLGGNMAERSPLQRSMPAHCLHAAAPRQKSVCDPVGVRERRLLCPLVRPTHRRTCLTDPGTSRQHRPHAFRRAAGRQALRRPVAETGALLCADSRPRAADPRRADHRCRSPVAPPVLGTRRAHPRAPAGDERARGNGPHGRGRGFRLAGGNGRWPRAGHRQPGRTQGEDRQRHSRAGVHLAAARRQAR